MIGIIETHFSWKGTKQIWDKSLEDILYDMDLSPYTFDRILDIVLPIHVFFFKITFFYGIPGYQSP